MENFYEYVIRKGTFKLLKLEDVAFAEYNCPIDQDQLALWTPHDYIVYVLSGKKTWRTHSQVVELGNGEALYVNKGACIVQQHFERDFCLLLIFIKDEFKKSMQLELPLAAGIAPVDPGTVLYPIKMNASIQTYFNSILSYFTLERPPGDSILRLKFQELFHILASESGNFQMLQQMKSQDDLCASLKRIMFQNYTFNLTLEEYAELCHRSLSSFKRDFKKCFRDSPGKWLMEQRNNKAATLLVNSHLSITEIAFECGFENLSHFSRSFRSQFHQSPRIFRMGNQLISTGN
jgi:AraC-like DNA-binding protein